MDKNSLISPVWRLNNLYTITTKEGKVVPFRPTEYQNRIIKAVYEKNRRRIIVLKARRMGMSTLIDLMALDSAYFSPNFQASIVDLTQGDASEKLKTKCRFALDNFHEELKEKLVADSSKQLAFQNGSTINAGKNARGGTNQFLHISEWGPIAYEDPRRSEEIMTGALPSADTGIIMVESTFKGGKGGHFYDLIKRSMETPDHQKTDKDFWFYFFPWYDDHRHTLNGDTGQIDSETTEYLSEMESELGITFTPGQKLWYFKTKCEQGIFMFREYPTTPEEAFRAPVEGAIYGDIISTIRSKGQIRPLAYDSAYPVYTSWDLGWADSTSVWFWQLIGNQVYWLKNITVQRTTAGEMATLIRDTGIPIAGHFLPHDAAAVKGGSGLNYQAELEKAGLMHTKVVPRTRDIWTGINQMRDILQRSWFAREECKEGLEALEAYHTKDIHSTATITKEPVHDWASHPADAARYAAEAINLGMVVDNSGLSREHQQRVTRPRRRALSGIKL
jgi:hypothetical protein